MKIVLYLTVILETSHLAESKNNVDTLCKKLSEGWTIISAVADNASVHYIIKEPDLL